MSAEAPLREERKRGEGGGEASTHLGGDARVGLRAARRGVEVEPDVRKLVEDVRALLLEARRRKPRGLQAVDRVDQLPLPATAPQSAPRCSVEESGESGERVCVCGEGGDDGSGGDSLLCTLEHLDEAGDEPDDEANPSEDVEKGAEAPHDAHRLGDICGYLCRLCCFTDSCSCSPVCTSVTYGLHHSSGEASRERDSPSRASVASSASAVISAAATR